MCAAAWGAAICTLRAPETLLPSSVRWRPTRRRRGSPCAWCASRPGRWRSWRNFSPAGSPTLPTGTATTTFTRWLAELGGKKLHAKRNHINRFVENNPTWTYEEITPATLPECLEMDKEWYRRSLQREGDAEERDLGDEGIALRTAMEHYEELGLEGGLIRVYGEVVAFTIGDRLSADTYDVHFEKAYGELQGAYAMINREFARWVRARHPEIRYLNREDDMGVEGLRKAKKSYYPDLMVEKHTAVMK